MQLQLALPPASTLQQIAEPQGKGAGACSLSPSTTMAPGYISHLPAAGSHFLKEFYSPECGRVGSFAARWVLCWCESLSARGAAFIIAGLWPRRRLPPAFVSAESRRWRGSQQPPAEIILIVCTAGSALLCLTW